MLTLSNVIAASALAVLIGIIGLIPFFRRRPAAMHILWLIVLAKFVTPAFISIPLFPAEVLTLTRRQVSVPPAPLATLAENKPSPIIAKPIIEDKKPSPFPWPSLLIALSLTGSLLILLHALRNAFRLRSLLRHAAPNPRLAHLIDLCRQRMSLPRAPVALAINVRCSPFLLAIPLRPRIYIPQAMLDPLSDAELGPIICHELAHHLRRDAIADLFAFLVAAALWWNPLVWLARRQLRCAQELCCDALVIARHPISRRGYAEILLSTLDQLTGAYSTPTLLATGWGNVSSLKERFRMIGDRNVVPRLSRGWVLVVILLAVSLLCIPGRAQPKPADPPAATDTPKSKIWKAQLIDGDTGKPLPGVRLHANAAIKTTDADGIVEISIPEGGGSALSLASQGYWSANMNMLGGSIEIRRPGEKKPPAPDPNKPTQIKAWRGTTVTGRLLDPDAKPIPNATLIVGTYINNQNWKQRLDMDLSFNSWDHGDWANWGYHFDTDADGRFEITVPPDNARLWLRISTMDFGANYATDQDPNGPAKALVKYAPFEHETRNPSDNGKLDLGDLQVTRGTVLRGQVVDADGKPLSGIMLYTSGKHGPYWGRAAVSGPDGRYQFFPMHPGPFTLSPYAQLRDEKGNATSRDVQAVFLPQEINLAETEKPVDLIVRAVPHITLEFDWIDRRAKKGPVAYYGTFELHGQVKLENGKTAWWRGETELTTRDGKQILFVKVPRALKNPTLTLPADSVVTASYEDDQQKSGPAGLELKDITEPRHRVIYGDEPKARMP